MMFSRVLQYVFILWLLVGCSIPFPSLCVTSSSVPAELSNDTLCKSFGFNDLTGYQYNFPVTSPYGQSSSPFDFVFFPLYSSQPVPSAVPSPDIVTAVVFVHGLAGNANSYFCSGMATSKGHAGTLVIAPWFGNEQILSTDWQTGAVGGGGSVYWDTNNWDAGSDASPSPRRFTTSFDVMDALLDTLIDPKQYPSLQLITVVGFSAGAQFVNRYAWATLGASPKIRFIIGDAGTYLYLDGRRPDTPCRPLYNNGLSICTSFITPPSNEISKCPTYNSWKYGLHDFPTSLFLTTHYPNASSIQSSIALFKTKDVRFILGKNDTCNCNTDGYKNDPYCYFATLKCSPHASTVPDNCCDTFPDSTSSNAVDVKCSSMFEGSNRLQRGLNYVSYLNNYFTVKFPVSFVNNMGHNNTALYVSQAFQNWGYNK